MLPLLRQKQSSPRLLTFYENWNWISNFCPQTSSYFFTREKIFSDNKEEGALNVLLPGKTKQIGSMIITGWLFDLEYYTVEIKLESELESEAQGSITTV